MATIKAIDTTTVHRICSGQVAVSLEVAVKELLENSLDAGATTIDLRFKEYGKEQVEIVDNGSGIHSSDFRGLALKHHTSKLRDFCDLTSVGTFGFRGEALSSLCAVSELSVVTRHESQPCGATLLFDRNGHLVEEKPTARQVGTTVVLKHLFNSLPVRKKDFHKNLQREFNKMIQLVSAYCLVSTGVRITCINQTSNGSRTTFVATQGCKSVKENISSVFGAKQVTKLLELRQKPPPHEVLDELKVSRKDCEAITLQGYFSSCAHGAGRASNDRQFFFINSRPFKASKVMKKVNSVYHQFNRTQYPFVFLDIQVSQSTVDVNVTPDKRQVFLTQEHLLLAIIEVSLLDLYEKIPSTFIPNPLKINVKSGIIEKSTKSDFSQFHFGKRNSDAKRPSDLTDKDGIPPRKCIKIEGPTQQTLDSLNIKKSSIPADTSFVRHSEINKYSEGTANQKEGKQVGLEPVYDENVITSHDDEMNSISISGDVSKAPSSFLGLTNGILNNASGSLCEDNSPELKNRNNISSLKLDFPGRTDERDLLKVSEGEGDLTEHHTIDLFEGSNAQMEDIKSGFVDVKSESTIREETVPNIRLMKYDEFEERGLRYVTCDLDMSSVRIALNHRVQISLMTKEGQTSVRFRASINPKENDHAEQELRKEITKDLFEKMDIIGQFNVGFIITKLESDLFIVDQHASDEKFNFETLQKNTVIQIQKLVTPKPLEITAANECVLFDNIEVFKKNGFEFKIDEAAPPTKKICLTAIPMSENWVFGEDDIHELIFMLKESQGSNCRPSRIRDMFASRACRKSVMIGTALSPANMRRIIDNMATLEQPWNCPHGRPTIRHLVNLELISSGKIVF